MKYLYTGEAIYFIDLDFPKHYIITIIDYNEIILMQRCKQNIKVN